MIQRILIATLTMLGLSSCTFIPQERAEITHQHQAPSDTAQKRQIALHRAGQWIGAGISYGAYRDGESPDADSLTSDEHILEDLQIISKHWKLIRCYGSGQQTQNILRVIQEHQLDIVMMLGAWLDGHWSWDKNHAEVDRCIELAKAFPNIVIAVNIGNEIFVDWSYHRLEGDSNMEKVIQLIRKVRSQIRQPVTVCDDYNFWNKPQAQYLAKELDFIGLHAYAFWNNITLASAVNWTKDIYHDIQQRFPNLTIALCESGWPTSRVTGDGSYEGGLIGKAGEKEQAEFLKHYQHWILTEKIPSFLFEAFDEKWKGGFDGENPHDKCEKHWGLYKSNRKAKSVMLNGVFH